MLVKAHLRRAVRWGPHRGPLSDALQGLHVDCIAQVRVAYALVPQAVNAHGVLTQLEERLMLEPASSRRAVLSLHEKQGGKTPHQMGLRRNSRPKPLTAEASSPMAQSGLGFGLSWPQVPCHLRQVLEVQPGVDLRGG
jgi:hypothetical protein